MCLILDTNKYGEYLNPEDQDMQPVREWVEKKGKIAYAPTVEMRQELKGYMKKRLLEYGLGGRLKEVSTEKVHRAEKEIAKELKKDKKLRSEPNDMHILALAWAANVKLLVSSDRKLHKDFTNPKIINGKVYQNKTHKHLLHRLTCP